MPTALAKPLEVAFLGGIFAMTCPSFGSQTIATVPPSSRQGRSRRPAVTGVHHARPDGVETVRQLMDGR